MKSFEIVLFLCFGVQGYDKNKFAANADEKIAIIAEDNLEFKPIIPDG